MKCYCRQMQKNESFIKRRQKYVLVILALLVFKNCKASFLLVTIWIQLCMHEWTDFFCKCSSFHAKQNTFDDIACQRWYTENLQMTNFANFCEYGSAMYLDTYWIVS